MFKTFDKFSNFRLQRASPATVMGKVFLGVVLSQKLSNQYGLDSLALL